MAINHNIDHDIENVVNHNVDNNGHHLKQCSHCGFIGKPVHDEYSSLLIDVFAWVFCLVAAVITANIYVVMIGVAVSLWHIITFKTHRCPKCGEWDMHRMYSLFRHKPVNHTHS